VARLLDRAARAFLARHRVARLATADRAAIPHVVPLCYAVSGDAVYFVVDEKPKQPGGRALKRMRNLAENPAVALVVDEWSEDWSKLAFLLIRGTGTIITAPRERGRALRALRARYPQYRAMHLDGVEHPIVRIVPTHLHRWRADVTNRAGGARSRPCVATAGRRTPPPRRSRPPRR